MTTTTLPHTAFPTLDAHAAQLTQQGSETAFPKIIEECQRLVRDGQAEADIEEALAAWEAFFR